MDDKFIQVLSGKLIEANNSAPSREQIFQAALNTAADIVDDTPTKRDDKLVAALQEFKDAMYDDKTGAFQNVHDVVKFAINLNKARQ